MKNFTWFSCKVLNVGKKFLINNLHNKFLSPQDIKRFNHTREVKSSDFFLENLGVIVKRDMKNNSECFDIFFLEAVTFYENHTVISCKPGDKRSYCGDFKLIFSEGVISHLNLKTQKFAHLSWGGRLWRNSMKIYRKSLQRQIFRWVSMRMS